MSVKELPQKTCEFCGKIFNRKRFGKRLEDATRYRKRKFCSRSCANSKKNPNHRTTFGLRARPFRKGACEICGSKENLDAHHLNGNIKDNRKENIRTLCHSCHMKLHWQQNPHFGGTGSKPTDPEGWTGLDASEMQLYLPRSTRSLKQSRISKKEQRADKKGL